MDRVVLGDPGLMSAWGFYLVENLMQRSGAIFQKKFVDRHHIVDETNPGTPSLTFAHYPNPSLSDFVRNNQMPAVILLDEPSAALRHLQATNRTSSQEALRAMSASAALLGTIREGAALPVVTRDEAADVPNIAKQIADHLKLGLSSNDIKKVLCEIEAPTSLEGALAAFREKMSRNEAKSTTAPEDDNIAMTVLTGLYDCVLGRPNPTVTWPYQVFLSGDRPNEPATIVADATGPARIIYYGPYFHLPAGVWSARAVIGFSEETIGTPFSIAAYSKQLLGKGRVLPKRAGIFSATFLLQVDQPQDPIEVRFSIESGAIDGRVSLGKIEFLYVRGLE